MRTGRGRNAGRPASPVSKKGDGVEISRFVMVDGVAEHAELIGSFKWFMLVKWVIR